MIEIAIAFGTIVGVAVIVILGIMAMLKAFYVKVPQGTALIKNGLFLGEPKVSFTGPLFSQLFILKNT